MATTPTRPDRRDASRRPVGRPKASRTSARRTAGRRDRRPRGRPYVVWVGVLVVVGAAALIAVLASGGGTGTKTQAGISETRPVAATGTALVPLRDSGADPAVGVAAPELRGQTFDGRPIAITDDGQPKIVVFLAHWCPHCQREVPVLTAYLDGKGFPTGVRLVAVATSTTPDRPNYPPSAWLARTGWPVETMADDGAGTAASNYGLTSFPYFVAIDRQGRVAARITGEISTTDFDRLVAAARTG